MNSEVKVFCPVCRGGDNVIWEGSLIDWSLELSKPTPPEWFNYALRHQKAHGHKLMVKYPSRTVPFDLSFQLSEEAKGHE